MLEVEKELKLAFTWLPADLLSHPQYADCGEKPAVRGRKRVAFKVLCRRTI